MVNNGLVKCFSNSDLGVNLTTILIDMEPWFIAKEVAAILGYSNLKKAIVRNVDEADQKLLSYDECKQLFDQNILDLETLKNTDNFGGVINDPSENSIKINNNGMKFINESGLYSLILGSKKPEARAFKRWVTSEVLPSIRKTGQYNVQKQSYMIDDPIERARAWIKEQEEKRALEAEKEQLKLANETLETENNELVTHNKELSITNDELITENELLRNDHFNTKQVYEQYQLKFPNAPRQALSTMLNKIRKLLCNITNERQSGRRIYKKHVTNKKGDIEWRQEYFFDKDTLQIFLDHVRDNLNYVINFRLK